MLRSLFIACVVSGIVASTALAAGPFGTIKVGEWNGGIYTNNDTGAFSHCGVGTTYGNGVTLIVGREASNAWLIGFAGPNFQFNKGETFAIDVLLEGQIRARLVGTALARDFVQAILPAGVASDFGKASFMAATVMGNTYQFNLVSTESLMSVLTSCVAKAKANGVEKAGDFIVTKPNAAKSPAKTADASSAAPVAPKQGKTVSKSGTGFVISPDGHVVTNHHVIDGCVGDIQGNLAGQAPVKLRVVSSDERNDLALMQGPEGALKEAVMIRGKPIHSGDSVVAIGYPFHGLLTSDFTVTTGIVNSLSGILNDTRFLQISAAVQPGNSGGPLLDTGGEIVGMVAAKIDTLKFVRVTGNIPENINFAIKTGAIRDFLDNSAVPYQTADPRVELKVTDIAQAARAYTLLISCTASEQAESTKK
jgi:S1-C subfamily serine protease